MDAPNEKLQELQQLPQFPAVATKVLRVLSHDDANVSEISDFIRADSALAAGLLRTANSALYAFPSPITSIQNALMMLGRFAVLPSRAPSRSTMCSQSAPRSRYLANSTSGAAS